MITGGNLVPQKVTDRDATHASHAYFRYWLPGSTIRGDVKYLVTRTTQTLNTEPGPNK